MRKRAKKAAPLTEEELLSEYAPLEPELYQAYEKKLSGGDPADVPGESEIIGQQPEVKEEPAVVEKQIEVKEEPAVVEKQLEVKEEPEVVEKQLEVKEEPAVVEKQPEITEEPAVTEEQSEAAEDPVIIKKKIVAEKEPGVTEESGESEEPAKVIAKTTPAEPKQTEPEQSESNEESSDEPEEKKNKKKEKKSKTKKQKQSKKEQSDGKHPKKKRRHITPFILLAILLAIIGGCLFNVYYCQTHFAVNFYQVESMHVSSDIRIVVLSDVHLAEYGEDNSELVSAVRALNPDIIISAGDMVSYGVSDYDNMLSLCTKLSEIAPFYGVMGNHEDEKTYLEGDEELRDRFTEAGMIRLINKCEKIRIRNNDIELVGVSGNAEGFDNYGGKKMMDQLDDNSTALRICIAHVPTLFDERLSEYDFDLGIAGHTHGGVVRLPMVGGLYSAEEGFRPKYDGGMYKLDNGASLFVSRGLGNSGKIPRFNNTPELAVLDIRWY